ncbi:NlpC/P60 family protein [Mesobacterium sp. TK19101]|uniref:NlpC/P60 family protein n=1 Tax=Mesobacterium hydrothermale TaxID=3111907 RepID=A0ABU6HBB0_9RHOB|nr:NlpC/P60 family protein [Mesobacterium sp. TK19101]MEC3859754.1 NlpC/P60 family protein [Mesobacterium sp. TK19101]
MTAPTDRRPLRSNGHVAHSSLQGLIAADRFTDGTPQMVTAPHPVDLLNAPDGKRDRQLLTGAGFTLLDTQGPWAFGFATRDGYVGWVAAHHLGPAQPRTHRVAVARAIGLDSRSVKQPGTPVVLPYDSAVQVTEQVDTWAGVRIGTDTKWFRANNLAPLPHPDSDPVTVAERLLGTPYLWGGNSALGIDCSGLVQTALHACGIDCPGDSDLQEKSLGQTLPPGTPATRGDLFFWKGHVAMAVDADTLIHANAWTMTVAYEPIATALTRIDAQGDGPLTRHARLS